MSKPNNTRSFNETVNPLITYMVNLLRGEGLTLRKNEVKYFRQCNLWKMTIRLSAEKWIGDDPQGATLSKEFAIRRTLGSLGLNHGDYYFAKHRLSRSGRQLGRFRDWIFNLCIRGRGFGKMLIRLAVAEVHLTGPQPQLRAA
jgi:hypothetical protein